MPGVSPPGTEGQARTDRRARYEPTWRERLFVFLGLAAFVLAVASAWQFYRAGRVVGVERGVVEAIVGVSGGRYGGPDEYSLFKRVSVRLEGGGQIGVVTHNRYVRGEPVRVLLKERYLGGTFYEIAD